MKNKPQKQSGFTIVELLIVIVIIAILAAIGFVSYNRIIDKGQAAATRNIVQQYSKVLGAFYADNGRYPNFNDIDEAEVAALPEDQRDSGFCLGTGYSNGCGSDLGKSGELQSFHGLLSEYVGQTPPNISPHDIPLVIDPGNGISMRIVGVSYVYFDPLELAEWDGTGSLNGDPTQEFSIMVYALDEADAECIGGKTLGIYDFQGNFDRLEYHKNTLTDNENTGCAVLLEE